MGRPSTVDMKWKPKARQIFLDLELKILSSRSTLPTHMVSCVNEIMRFACAVFTVHIPKNDSVACGHKLLRSHIVYILLHSTHTPASEAKRKYEMETMRVSMICDGSEPYLHCCILSLRAHCPGAIMEAGNNLCSNWMNKT